MRETPLAFSRSSFSVEPSPRVAQPLCGRRAPHATMNRELDRIYQSVLVLRCQAGDEAAFAELVGRYQPRLRAFLRPMLDGDAHRAQDVLQDVWLDVFRSVGKLRDVDAFTGWLYRIARDRAYRA